ncbi:zinc metalloproteinase-disintegrin-like MTP9 [Erythrolamprus reginae]|uniref:zinc metalloproteinase-disintegrin-like MTP9 n=1 Tax=Erythrolamprus reginae TaxID=121349 RepID=UPI00396CAE18
MIQALFITICLAVFPYQGSSIILESGHVNDYEVVYPQKVSALPKGGFQNAVPETKYEDTMKYEFHVNGEPVVLHLERNKGLFSEDYSETHYSPDGREITTTPPVQDHCYYHGHIQDEADTTAVISACNGLKGQFKHQGETYFIEPLEISNSEAHAVYKYESLDKEDNVLGICGVTETTWESDEPIEKISQLAVTPEQVSLKNPQQNTYLDSKKYIEFFIVVDNGMIKKYSRNLAAIKTRVYEIVNIMNKIYKALDIYVALIGLEFWSNQDKINVQKASNVTLALFGEWRERDLLPRRSHDNAQLLTSIDFNGATVGRAYVGTLCQPKHSSGVIQDHKNSTSLMASTMAHELGHNLGINHDNNSCDCSSKACVMYPKISSVPLYEFSNCSREEHRSYLLRKQPQCILNKPLITDIIAPAVCGNYFVEVGEECDCGSPKDCKSTCCNAATCKLRRRAKCDTGECCEKCKFKKATVECRAVKDDCDVAENCTGRSAECPTDQFQRDGHPCQNDQGYCYNRKCPTLTKQCIALFGAGKPMAPDECFQNNRKGDKYSYCKRENNSTSPCEPKDVKCGRLYCAPKNELSCEATYKEKNPDYGMVDHGTKCGDKKVCHNRECVDVETAY